MYYESLLIKHKQNSRMIWKTVNEILNKRLKNNDKISKTFIQTNSSNILDDPEEIANEFNDYFVNDDDGISAKILKKVAKEISKALTHIFNLTFLNGIIPDWVKFALVTPIYKGNEEKKFENYRPISVLNCFLSQLKSSSMDKIYMDKNGILSKHQYGFRKNRSTELAILDFTDRNTKAIDERKFTVGIFLDLSKA